MSIESDLMMLKSPDVKHRKEAIVALGKSGDKRALKPLAEIYKTDPDPAVRDLALKAGRHIQKVASQMVETAPPPPKANPGGLMFVSAEESSAVAPTTSWRQSAGKKQTEQKAVPDWMEQMGGETPKKKASESEKRKAQSFLDRALDAQVRGEPQKVLDFLEAAIDTDPDMEKNSQVLGLIAMILNVSGDQAVGALRAFQDQPSNKKRAKATQGNFSELIDFGIEMAIWVIVVALFVGGAAYLVLASLDWNEVIAEAQAQGATPTEIDFYQQAREQFTGDQLVVNVVKIAFIYSGLLTLYTTILSTFIWIVGMFLGGTGMMFKFITSTFRAVAVILVASTLFAILGFFVSSGSDLAIMLGFAPIGFGVFYMGYAIGKAHEFGVVMGCLTMIASVFACNMLSCGLNFLLAF